MKTPIFPLLAALVFLTSPLHADPLPDLLSPKAENSRLLRVFLYIPGIPRLIDYPDVEKIISCDKDRIAFETQDGQIVFHNGPFTVIQPRNASAASSGGPRFFDLK
jgi:hypothetical protein